MPNATTHTSRLLIELLDDGRVVIDIECEQCGHTHLDLASAHLLSIYKATQDLLDTGAIPADALGRFHAVGVAQDRDAADVLKRDTEEVWQAFRGPTDAKDDAKQ